jgi:hypothetical protein
MRSIYRELGIELIELGKDFSSQPKWSHIAEEKRDNGVEYPIKLFLKEPIA